MKKESLKDVIRSSSKSRYGSDISTLRNQEEVEEDFKAHTISIKPSFIDKLKDYVHMRKIEDDPYFTQGRAVQEALELLFTQAGDISSRPDSLKKKEAKRTGRKARGSSAPNDDIFS